jgi:hypothetical protein
MRYRIGAHADAIPLGGPRLRVVAVRDENADQASVLIVDDVP